MGVMVGNMLGTSLATAPAFVVGQLCDVLDLDGPFLLAADREHHVIYEDGKLICPSGIWVQKMRIELPQPSTVFRRRFGKWICENGVRPSGLGAGALCGRTGVSGRAADDRA